VLIIRQYTTTCFDCPDQPSSGKYWIHKTDINGSACPYVFFAYPAPTWWWLIWTAETCCSV